MKLLLLLVLISGCTTSVNNPTERRAPAPSYNNSIGYFIIGTQWPRPDEMATWKARGVNTVVDQPGDVVDPNWDAAATSLNLKMIKSAPELTDVNNPNVVAWAQLDEPTTRHAEENLPLNIAKYQQWKSLAPGMPIFENFGGGDILHDSVSLIASYFNQTADWICNDYYPVTNGLPITDLERPIDVVAFMTSKPQLAYIETSYQVNWSSSGRGPTRDEVRAEIWLAIVRGVKGIIYFPQSTASNDATTPDVAAEITTQNATITSLSQVLESPINPQHLITSGPSPLRSASWQYNNTSYFVFVNPAPNAVAQATLSIGGFAGSVSANVLNENRTVTIQNGQVNDSFDPFSVHIFVVTH